MGRKNRRRGARELDADLIEEILSEQQPHPSSSCEDATFPATGKVKEETAADRAYTHAVEACDRIIAELEKELRSDHHVRSR